MKGVTPAVMFVGGWFLMPKTSPVPSNSFAL